MYDILELYKGKDEENILSMEEIQPYTSGITAKAFY